eukprot:1232508-Rhodomonas_salina.1
MGLSPRFLTHRHMGRSRDCLPTWDAVGFGATYLTCKQALRQHTTSRRVLRLDSIIQTESQRKHMVAPSIVMMPSWHRSGQWVDTQ